MPEYKNSDMLVIINEYIHHPRYREILRLRFCDGFTYEEIAGEVNFLLLAFNGGFGGFGGGDIYPWLNNSQNINDGFRDQFLNENISGIRSDLGDISTQLCNGFNGTQMSILQSVNGLQSQLASCCCDNRLATVQTQNIVAAESAATRATIQSGVQAVLDKMCQDKIDAKNEKIVELNSKINALESNNYIQNALTAQTQYFLGLYPPPATA